LINLFHSLRLCAFAPQRFRIYLKMQTPLNLSKFAKYAWFVIAYNIAVILWGAFVRASLSGDGCGAHWLTCNGEVVPFAPATKTIIEFSHRVSSGLAFFAVLILCVWAFRKFVKGNAVRKFAFASIIFIATEALIGAGLVLFRLVATNPSMVRAFSMSAHLINTFILLSVLTITAWLASGGKPFAFRGHGRVSWILHIGVFGFLLVGVSGGLAALGDTLFPATSFSEGFWQDFSDTSHILLRLRISHPILSVSLGAFLAFTALWFKSKSIANVWIERWANVLIGLVVIQFIAGFINLFLLAPIVMQIVHLLLADLLWIVFVLLSANVLAEKNAFATHKTDSVLQAAAKLP